MRAVSIVFRDYPNADIERLTLNEGERIVNVESGTRFSPTRVWIERPAQEPAQSTDEEA